MEHSIVASLRARKRSVLGRAVSVAENGGERASNLLQLIKPFTKKSAVIGFTGAPGSGKSSLIDVLIAEFRRRGLTVAVVAIDPSSPFSGGAVLGDRCRMNRHQKDEGVYIRSLSARGSVGGLSAGVSRVINVLQVSDFNMILIETVGAGQSEVDVFDLVDVCVVVCTPNSGDDIQAIKSGILEIADIVVANKTDLVDTNGTVPQLIMAQSLRANAHKVPVLPTVATANKGIAELADEILERCKSGSPLQQDTDQHRIKKRLVRRIARGLEERLLGQDNETLDQLCESIRRKAIDIDEAVRIWLDNEAAKR